MRKISFRVLSLLILLTFLIPSFSGCSESAGNADETAPVQSSDTPAPAVEVEEEEKKLLPDLPDDLDYAGADVVIMQHPFSAGDWADWLSRDIWSDGLTGEPINDAVFDRNAYVEEKLNVVIKAEDVANMPDMIQKQVTSGSGDYNISTARIQSLPNTVTRGISSTCTTCPTWISRSRGTTNAASRTPPITACSTTSPGT